MGLFDPKQKSTQEHLDIEDIRDDLVILRNGKVSLVIETTSLNFDLLANQEQDARIYTFAGLLNSLTFPIQIVIRTQKTDVSKYVNMLEDYKRTVGSSPIQQQVTIYQEFIRNLTVSTEILNKRFYAVIPTFNVAQVQPVGLKQIFGGKPQGTLNTNELLVRAKNELYPKRDHLIKQFANMGLAARQLRTDELIKLYYSIYEPDKVGLEVLNIKHDSIDGAIVDTQFEKDDNSGASVVESPTDALDRKPINTNKPG